MSGIEIQYLLGLYFAINNFPTVSTTPEGKKTLSFSNVLIFGAGVVLIALSVLGYSPIR